MSETKVAWTPGPWAVSAKDGHEVVAAYRPKFGLPVASAKTYVREYQRQSLANAHLIAASPDLYEALKWALAEIDGLTRYDAMGQRERSLARARAALAKAEGRTDA
jgi:hypothetical protein